MPFDYQTIKNWRFEPIRQELTNNEVILYALAVGYGFEPLDRRQLRFVYEQGLLAAPTLATVLAHPGFWMRYPAAGVDWKRTVHTEQRLTLHSPIPVAGTIVGRTHVAAVVDRGAETGAIVYQEHQLSDQAGRPFATLVDSTLCRGDGGLSRSDGPPEAPPAVPVPDTPPELSCDLPTLPHSALLYRLLGDANPLHADPDLAVGAGLERPSLHGLCTFGIACHAIVRTLLDYDPSPLRSLYARFTAPVYPGETIRTEMWRHDNEVLFQARAVERDVVVLSDGAATLKPER
jgi:acyl dehydratase